MNNSLSHSPYVAYDYGSKNLELNQEIATRIEDCVHENCKRAFY